MKLFDWSPRRARDRSVATLHRLLRSDDAALHVATARQAVGRYPADPEVQIEYATALASAGEARSAADSAWVAANAEGSTTVVLARAASLLVDAGHIEEAEQLIRRIDRSGPQHELLVDEVIHLRGQIAAARGEDASAEGHLRDAVDRDPTDPRFVVSLAEFLVTRGRRDDALALLPAIDRVKPRDHLLKRFAQLGLL